MRRILLGLCFLSFLNSASGQEIPLPESMPQAHPRVLTTPEGKQETWNLIKTEEWAKDVFDKLRERTEKYTDLTATRPDWLLSRLAMYWKSHATEVYIKGETFDHAGGEKAPYPTVRYTGTRGTAATHGRPRLADIVPYDDDNGNVTFCNNALPDRPMESVHPSKTGRNIESLNCEILGIARDAAFLYWMTEEEKFAKLAAGVFDTYMTGIYYRNVPVDLNHGHQQTLVGLTSFEVIHEDALHIAVPLYDFLYDYLKANYPQKMEIYAGAFKKWADNIIANGVPHNNWDLLQARFIMNVGLVLEDNKAYADGKGREYYIDYVMNRSSIRQWSLTRLAEYGFDSKTGIWAECPGYSSVVINDYANFVNQFDNNLRYDLVKAMPVLSKAVATTPQYLFPNRMICGFGDTHPGYLNTNFFVRMIQNAQANGKKEQEDYFTALLKCLNPGAGNEKAEKKNVRVSVNSFFEDKPLTLNPEVQAGKIEEYVSPLFHAPNVSWLVQRNGMDPRSSLMISQNGSEGNHMHANGISMELYGKGYVLGPDAGIGLFLYSGLDYAEYYSQFPSHNTVCVDGISSYPVMKSNHSFELLSCFPASAEPGGEFTSVTYSNLYFREPESRADQTRMMSIVTTAPETGYYVDVFRSRKEKGGDKMHDYFYHNLGQTLTLTAADGTDLNLQPTEELAFAGAHLYAYSYLYDKKVAATGKDVKATFTIDMKDKGGDDISMNLWMKGEPDREVFTALSPMTEGLSRTPGMPYNIKEQPTLTFVARQHGEAWDRPFVAVYEPSTRKEPSAIQAVSYFDAEETALTDFAGICVKSKNGRTDHIFSLSDATQTATYQGMKVKADYAVISNRYAGDNRTLFMGNGTQLIAPGVSIRTSVPANVLLEQKQGKWYILSSASCTVVIGGKKMKVEAAQKTKRCISCP
ncbi:heparinase II/III family protein [Bacteroides finegoldii]|uniref:Heparinase II/III-like protein n=1 Tax=Bacteroides finegoldii TaxID=338188 RepID=A0A173WK05_9BACE|nr:heparinase II/III family protein [Bacteroides finegoldii]CUN39833.1 Heparinase II/III-like protein [Bacteroides finegoldii]